MSQKAFSSSAGLALQAVVAAVLPPCRGKGDDRESPASYRPITLLNTGCMLAALAIASRICKCHPYRLPPQMLDWGNVLAHLEEISYRNATQQPGVLVFLDFEDAFHRQKGPGSSDAGGCRLAVLSKTLNPKKKINVA